MSTIEIYQTREGQTQIEVKFETDTAWLSLNQMAHLFGRDKSVISRHLKNIFDSEELVRTSVVAKNATTAADGKTYEVEYFNLDAIISVGYRVNSKQGTLFRQWATQRLKDYLVQGYALNEKRLQEVQQRFGELKQAIGLLEKLARTKDLSGSEAQGLLQVLGDFSVALDILDRYDHQQLTIGKSATKELFRISYEAALRAIEGLKQTFGGSRLFGNEKDESFQGSLAAIYQTFGGADVYPSVEEKAAHLLYFVVKNHSFSDGNKRIAAFLFVWFLERNGLLYVHGQKVIDDNALVALTLMIAESNPNDKDMMIKVIVNLIHNRK